MIRRKFNWQRLPLVFAILILITACAQAVELSPEVTTDPSGFWKGLWHGIIIIVSFVVSLFNDKVAMYDANNIGGWYDLGFILGILIAVGGGGRSTKR